MATASVNVVKSLFPQQAESTHLDRLEAERHLLTARSASSPSCIRTSAQGRHTPSKACRTVVLRAQRHTWRSRARPGCCRRRSRACFHNTTRSRRNAEGGFGAHPPTTLSPPTSPPALRKVSRK
eukprot:4504821-Prymnesium_polylepis.1